MSHAEPEKLLDARSLSSLQNLIRSKTGIYLLEREFKSYERQILPFMRENGFQNIKELIESLEKGRPGIVQKTVDLFICRETFFFRDPSLYKMLEETLLPPLLAQKDTGKSLRIWSAACSTGEEPYSLAIFMKEKFAKTPVEILGTDLSADTVDKAKLGIYPQEKITPHIPKNLLSPYFRPLNGDFQICTGIRQMVRFQIHNLLNPLESSALFDVILCRNVLSSFEGSLKAKVLDAFVTHLTRDGLLILGSHEILL